MHCHSLFISKLTANFENILITRTYYTLLRTRVIVVFELYFSFYSDEI